MTRERHPSFVCFSCRISVPPAKYSRRPPACPSCGKPCDHWNGGLIAGCPPLPPSEQSEKWRGLEQDYRKRQQEINAEYLLWKQQVITDLQQHLAQAEVLGLDEIAADDRLWLEKIAGLDETPFACSRPMLYGRNMKREAATASGIGNDDPESPVNVLIAESRNKPYSEKQQAELDERIYCKNSLHIYDIFGQIWHQYGRKGDFQQQRCFLNRHFVV